MNLTRWKIKPMTIRMKNAEEWISDLDDRIMKISQLEEQTETQINKMKGL